VALVAHAYYVECLDEVVECYAKLPLGAALIVTTRAETLEEVRRRLAEVAHPLVIAVPNRGRDIAPFLTLLNGGELDDFDVVLKLHTKRSPNLLDGDIRRKLLFSILAGSRRRTTDALDLFTNRETGLVGWGLSWQTGPEFWMGDRERVLELASEMHIPAPPDPCFFEGSMFWVRPAALGRLKALALTPESFEAEVGQTDGALHHAIERLFGLVAAADGFAVRDVRGRVLLDFKDARA
jgi:rhamnosyltransferase